MTRKSLSPFDELARLFDRMQDNVEEIARDWDEEELESLSSTASSVAIDLKDEDEAFVLTAELPGFDKNDIDLRVTDRTLRLEAEHETESEEESEGDYIRRERRSTSVARSVTLPAAVEADDVSATFQNGVLTVRLPKTEPTEDGEKIEVE
ncbi:MAG: Hsp20/alpha crystallin family protein [Haloplanus sp.]